MSSSASATSTRQRRNGALTEDELHQRFPTLQYLSGASGNAAEKAWVAAFSVHPDAMHDLIADYIKQVYARPGRIGQRPMPKEEEVDFQALIYGETTDLSLSEVLPKLITASTRVVAPRIPMSRTQWRRTLSGDYQPDISELRAIAKIASKPPAFFREYRQAMAVRAFVHLVYENPGIATSLYRQYIDVRM